MNAFKDVFKLLRLQTQCSACLDPGLWMSVVIQWISHVQLLATPWTAECQVSLSFIISWNLLELMSIASVMPSNYLILCRSLLLLPSIFLSIRVFSNELVLHIRWPNYCSFSFSISLSNEDSGLISFRTDWSPCCPSYSQESSPTPQFESINSALMRQPRTSRQFPETPTRGQYRPVWEDSIYQIGCVLGSGAQTVCVVVESVFCMLWSLSPNIKGEVAV